MTPHDRLDRALAEGSWIRCPVCKQARPKADECCHGQAIQIGSIVYISWHGHLIEKESINE